MKLKTAVIGASGYAGAQLVSLLSSHPSVESIQLAVQSKPGVMLSDLFQGFSDVVTIKTNTVENVLSQLDCLDVLFLALPHGISMELLSKTVLPEKLRVIDLGADFRLNDPDLFTTWYDLPHAMPDHLEKWVYGLPELNRESIRKTHFTANPGCYPTASLLAMMPALVHRLIEPESLIIDAKSGISGAGRSLSLGSLFCESSDSMKAYAVAGHRHTAEIEQTVSILCGTPVPLTFTPHLIPMKRGILSTIYGTLKQRVTQDEVMSLYSAFYSEEPFVRVRQELPETRWVAHSNFCDVSVRIDFRTGRLIMIGAIDNLMKGASSQAVQNMNIMFDMDETLGLPRTPIIP